MNRAASTYIKLLRLPYQFQLGPIFGWGFLLAGGTFSNTQSVLWFLLIFLTFHIGAFGGLTALNSYYDRDTGPVGGMWQPPPPPYLWLFAWIIQFSGLAILVVTDLSLSIIYAAVVLLALGYSHPRTRWKGHPWKSLTVVALGQGVLDFMAGVLTAPTGHNTAILALGMSGATLTVIAFYPLTQLYQLDDDTKRGDYTTVARLVSVFGRTGVLRLASGVVGVSAVLNSVALWLCGHLFDAIVLMLANLVVITQVWRWSTLADGTQQNDFVRIHRLMRTTALAFGVYILLRLATGGLYQ